MLLNSDLSQFNAGDYPELAEFSRSCLSWRNPLQVGGKVYSAQSVISTLQPMLTTSRVEKVAQVVSQRTRHFVPMLENIYDVGNINAVFRSSEAHGFITNPLIVPSGSRFKTANRVSKGAHKWLDVPCYSDSVKALQNYRSQGYQILATHLDGDSTPLQDVDLSRPSVLLFGNEKEGTSKAALACCDATVKIPMRGFSQSFNISVAAAICFFYVRSWMEAQGMDQFRLTKNEQDLVLAQYYLRCFDNPGSYLARQFG